MWSTRPPENGSREARSCDECQWDDYMRGIDDPWGQRADFERSINERIDAADFGSSTEIQR